MMNGVLIICRSEKHKNMYSLVATSNKDLMIAAWNLLIKDNLTLEEAMSLKDLF